MNSTQPTLLGVGAILADTYEIVREIGRGGMGAVFLAHHRRLPGKRFAVKVLLVAGDEAYARFRREAEIASRLGHPNIVEVVDWNTLPDGSPYLVMEFLEGQSLEERLQQGPMPLDAVCAVIRQIGSALAAAHRAGVVHRDLKPANVFLCPTDAGGTLSERVKVLDFGISKMRDSTTVQTQDMQLLGTPRYMAPEQALGENRSIDARTDLFALGAMVYEMLSGHPAFEGDSIAKVIYHVVNVDPQPLSARVPGLPPAVTGAVTRALSKPPEQRFPDVGSFVEALTGQALISLPERPPPTSPVDPSSVATEKTFVRTDALPAAPPDIAPVGTVLPSASVPAAMPIAAPPSPPLALPSPPAPAPSRSLLPVAAAVIIGALGVGYGVFGRSGVPAPAAPGPDAAEALVAAPGLDAMAAQPLPAVPPPPEAGLDAGPVTSADAGMRLPRVRSPEVLTPAAEKALEEVQAALDGRQFSLAVRLAERSAAAQFRRGRKLQAMAYCGHGRPELAMDLLKRAPLDPAEVKAVCQFCQARGSTLVCPPR